MVGKYKDLFIDNGIEDLETILEMDDKHLEQMSVPLGHKLKILKRIKEVRASKGMYVPPSRQGARDPPTKKETPQVEPNAGSGGVGTENQEKQGGSLLDGTYDEEEQ
jgi:hypothetical protein